MRKTVTIEDREYVVETMLGGDGLDIQEQVDEGMPTASSRQKSIQRTWRTVAASLRMTPEELRKVPWPDYLELIDHALEVNKMKPTAGEATAQDGASPAA